MNDFKVGDRVEVVAAESAGGYYKNGDVFTIAKVDDDDDELSKMRCDGTGPEFTKFRRNIRYNPRKVSEWLEANTRKSTKEESNA